MKKINFAGHNGEQLAARLDEPEGDIKAYALFAHCFTCTKDIYAASYIARTLVENGIAVFRFDFTGLGASEGDFSNTNFSSNVEDLVAAADYMRKNFSAPKLLIGHSLGGSAVLAAAPQVPESNAVVSLGSPADVAHVAHNFKDDVEQIKQDGEMEVCLVGRPFKIKKQFIDDIESVKLESLVANLKKAYLVMHAPLDRTVGIENAVQLFSWAKHPKSYVSLDDSDHLISNKEDAIYAGNVISAWAERYII